MQETAFPQKVARSGARSSLLAYFLIAFAGTWLVILPLALSQEGSGLLPYHLPDVVSMLIFIFAVFTGPALAAFVLTARESGRAGVRQLLKRMVQWRVGFRWYLVALFSFFFVFLAAYSLVSNGELLANLLQNWPLLFSVFLPSVVMGLIMPSLGEEPGWRGYALPRLQKLYGPVMATLVLGFLHGVWHLPAMFTPFLGPFTPARFLAFVLTATAGTFIYTWVFNNTRSSVFIAMLVHASSNAASQLLSQLIPADAMTSPLLQAIGPDWLNVIAFWAVALVLLVLTKGRLSYKEETYESFPVLSAPAVEG